MKTVTLFLLMLIASAAIAEPLVRMEADKTSGCQPLVVNFLSVTEIPDATWTWDFSNGYTSNQKTPTVVFMEPGVYQVKLTVGNGAMVETINTTITVYAAPKADFVLDKPKACSNEIVNFRDNSKPGDAPITTYVWGFGDGKTATTANTAHLYREPGSYTATLLVTDENGCSSNKTTIPSLEIKPAPRASFEPSPASSCVETQQVFFSNKSAGNIQASNWYFGDGTNSTSGNPTHTFSQGKRDVVLVVKDANQCADTITKRISVGKLQADFMAGKETTCAGEEVKFVNASNTKGTSWMWDFGDGTVSTECNPVKTYNQKGTYTVKMTINDGICSTTETKLAYVNVTHGSPVSFMSDVTSSCSSPTTINFKNTTPNGMLYLWDFGDGTVSTQENPGKVYAKAGNYTVSLTVTDVNGCTVKDRVENFIRTSKPVPHFVADTFGCPGYPMRFMNYTANASAYLWNFGDGESSTEKSPRHIYKNRGNYSITLTAYGTGGCDSTVVLANHITIDTIAVDFAITSAPAAVPPFLSTFVNKTNKACLKYIWDFGDGTTETGNNPVHIYDVPGTFDVRLVASTKNGCTNAKVITHSFSMGGASLNSPLVVPVGF